jgi:hypothetical protein
MEPVKFFVSYAHADEVHKDTFLVFLKPLVRNKEISIWNDRAIVAGEEWDDEIKNALLSSDVVVFLISPDFLGSDYINEVEIREAFKLHETKKAYLVPIMVRNCDINSQIFDNDPNTKISRFQGLPLNFKPIVTWPDKDEAWMNVVNGLKPLIKKIKNARGPVSP